MDRKGTNCIIPDCSGTYIETSLQDDWYGVVHCSVCNNTIKRHMAIILRVASRVIISDRGLVVSSYPGTYSTLNLSTNGNVVKITRPDGSVIEAIAYPEFHTPNHRQIVSLNLPEVPYQEVPLESIVWRTHN